MAQVRSKRISQDGLRYHGKTILDWIKNSVYEAQIQEANKSAKILNITAEKCLKEALISIKDNLPKNISKTLKNKLNKALDDIRNNLPKKISRDVVRTCDRLIKKVYNNLPDKYKDSGKKALENSLNACSESIRHDIKRIKRNNKDSYGKTELWLFVLFIIVNWYISHEAKGEPFFWSYKRLQLVLESCGYDCTVSGIEEALRVIEDMELIKIEYPRYQTGENKGKIISKAAWTAAGNNPNKYIFRKIYINWKNLYPWLSVYTQKGLDSLLEQSKEKAQEKGQKTNFGAKSRFIKLAKKRPISRLTSDIFKLAMADAGYEKYKSEKEMLSGFIATYGSKYYNPISFIKGYRPDHMINLQKEQDDRIDRMIISDLERVRTNKAQMQESSIAHSVAVYSVQDIELALEANKHDNTPEYVKEFYDSIK